MASCSAPYFVLFFPRTHKLIRDFVSDWRRREILTLKMLLSLKLWSLRSPHWHQKYQIYYLWLDTVEKNWGNQNQRDAATQVQSVCFSLRSFLAALVFFFFFFLDEQKEWEKSCCYSWRLAHALMHIYWQEREYWRQIDEKLEKSKGEKPIFVPIFSRDSHFGPYLLFSLLLVPI